MKLIYQTTFKIQLELLPRISIIYAELNEDSDFSCNDISFEFLWFSLFLQLKTI